MLLRAEEIQPRNGDEKTAEEMLKLVVNDNNAFALKLYSQLSADSKENLFFSPISISSSFVIPYLGADGATEEQIKQTLNFSLSQKEQQTASYQLARSLTSYNRTSDTDFRLILANTMWLQTGLALLPDFIQHMPMEDRERVRYTDFIHQPEVAREDINRRVVERTYGKIVDIIPTGMITSATRMMLVSSVYMKARWQRVFNVVDTHPMPFFPNPDQTLSVPMMDQTATFLIHQNDTCTILELPYSAVKSSALQLSMIILLPNQRDGLAEVEASLSIEQLNNWIEQLQLNRVQVRLPKFTLTQAVVLNQALSSMGMPIAFTPQASFAKMTKESLSIGKVMHKAFIAVDESGTEAAAATAISMNLTSVHTQPPVLFQADHPFIYFIMEKSTGTILFVGRLVQP